MKAHVYSSIDAHSLLHQLERTANQMPDIYSRAELTHHGGSTKIGQLNLSGAREGEIELATFTQHNDKILVAALDDDSSLDPLTSKRRLAAFLGPLLKQYNTTDKENLAADDQAIMIFEDDMQKRI
jgi:signal transduction protein with GAF and PtsI domain